jgi:hypothetical protein
MAYAWTCTDAIYPLNHSIDFLIYHSNIHVLYLFGLLPYVKSSACSVAMNCHCTVYDLRVTQLLTRAHYTAKMTAAAWHLCI